MQANYQTVRNEVYDNRISIPCFVLCGVIFLVLAVVPILPSRITQLFRPIVILACLLIPGKYSFRMKGTIQILAIYLFYMSLVFLCHPITHFTFTHYVSAVLFGAFFVAISQRVWSKREIRMLVIFVFLGSICYALLLQYYNHDLLHTSDSRVFRGVTVNPNAAAYTVCPGAFCGFFILCYYRRRSKLLFLIKMIVAAGTVFCYYALICLASRAAFFSGVAGAVMMAWEKFGGNSDKSLKRTLRVLLIVAIGFVVIAGPKLAEGTNAERIFNYEKLTDDNGREELNDRAIEMIREKPVFGGGYDYWSKESGELLNLHNGFLDAMVIGGVVAGILISLFFIYLFFDLWKAKSMVVMAFFIVATFHMFVDSGLDYFTYIPLILAYVLFRYSTFRAQRVIDIWR